MKSKVSKRSLSTAPASAGESDEDRRLRKKVRWDPKSDDEGTGTITASDDFEGSGEEHGSATSDNEKVRSLPHQYTFSSHSPVVRSVLRLAVKGRTPYTFELAL